MEATVELHNWYVPAVKSLLPCCAMHKCTYPALVRATVARYATMRQSALPATGSFREHVTWLARLQQECDLSLRESTPDAANEAGAGCTIDWGEATPSADEAGDVVRPLNWGVGIVTTVFAVQDDVDGDAVPPRDHAHLSLDVARGIDRTNLVTELRAVHSFLREYQAMQNENSHTGVGQEQAGDIAQLAGLIDATSCMMTTLGSASDAEFVRMRYNLRAHNDFTTALHRFNRAIAAAQTRRASNEHKAVDVAAEGRTFIPQLEELRTSACQVRDGCLAQLDLIFPDRTVTIVGNITRLIG